MYEMAVVREDVAASWIGERMMNYFRPTFHRGSDRQGEMLAPIQVTDSRIYVKETPFEPWLYSICVE